VERLGRSQRAMVEQAIAGAAGAAAFLAWAVRGRSATVLAPSVWHGPRSRKALALTFDDGPAGGTGPILNILDRHRVQATFFMCGRQVRRAPSLAAEVVAAGHEAGNHTDTHPHLWLQSRDFIREEIGRAQQSIAEATGKAPVLFRPPYGARWFGLRAAQAEHGLLGVMWSAIGLDWKLDGPAVSQRLLTRAHNGAIFCLHDGRDWDPDADAASTVHAVGEIVPRLLEEGWEFLPAGELVGYSKRGALLNL
jgi:peptidoglycan-N-acetylglucosamine deacetylase